jgi:holo-[acyl-carrier protein] synthase
MIIGIGVDLVKISRVAEIAGRWNERFLDRVFTPAERAYCLRHKFPHIRLSARFAVKEATLKALGIGFRMGIRWKEIETINNAAGKPEVILRGRTREIADQQGVSEALVSITHDHEYSIAQVILTDEARSKAAG